MMTKKEFDSCYWPMYDYGLREMEPDPYTTQIELTELDVPYIYRHRYDTEGLTDAKEKINWLLENTPCRDATLYHPGSNPVIWGPNAVSEREWTNYYGSDMKEPQTLNAAQ